MSTVTPDRLARIPVRRIYRVGLDQIELRQPSSTASGGDWYTITGHAAVFEQDTTLYSGKGYRVTESISRGAFDAVLASGCDVHLNIGHDMNRVLARTGISGVSGLDLSCDATGLRVHARVRRGLSYMGDLAQLMEDGAVDQMSFAFTIDNEERHSFTDASGVEVDHYTIRSVGDLYDVCVCAQGAYTQTDAELVMHERGRSLGVSRVDRTIAASDSPGDTGTIATDDLSGSTTNSIADQGADLAEAQRKARALLRLSMARNGASTR